MRQAASNQRHNVYDPASRFDCQPRHRAKNVPPVCGLNFCIAECVHTCGYLNHNAEICFFRLESRIVDIKIDLEAAGREWRTALLQSKMASIEARLARQRVVLEYSEAVSGRGHGPTAQQLKEVTLLEQHAIDLRLIEEAILNKVFGTAR